MSTQPEALRLADAIDPLTRQSLDNLTCSVVAAELRRLYAENEKLRTVMVAAAEEIAAHWDAHCDAEGYGPANLMRRLEDGIASEYGYTAGAFGRLRAQRDALLEALKALLRDPSGCAFCDSGRPRKSVLTGELCKHDDQCGFVLARAAIKAAEGENT